MGSTHTYTLQLGQTGLFYLEYFICLYAVYPKMISINWCYIMHTYSYTNRGGVCSVMVIIIGNGHSDSSSNFGLGCLHFTSH